MRETVKIFRGKEVITRYFPVSQIKQFVADIENEELEQENIDSVGGLIMAKIRNIPVEGQKISFDGFDVEVTKMNGAQIVKVKVYPGLA